MDLPIVGLVDPGPCAHMQNIEVRISLESVNSRELMEWDISVMG